VSFFSQGSGRVVTSCVVFEQWISAVVLFKLQTLQTTFAVVLLLSKLQNYFTIFYYLHADTFVSRQLFFYLQCCRYLLLFTQFLYQSFVYTKSYNVSTP
jgi:hypothetical protein